MSRYKRVRKTYKAGQVIQIRIPIDVDKDFLDWLNSLPKISSNLFEMIYKIKNGEYIEKKTLAEYIISNFFKEISKDDMFEKLKNLPKESSFETNIEMNNLKETKEMQEEKEGFKKYKKKLINKEQKKPKEPKEPEKSKKNEINLNRGFNGSFKNTSLVDYDFFKKK